jgi:acetylornithine deacetylase
MIEKNLIHILSTLVAINSVNPTLSKGPGEEEISAFIVDYLSLQGLTPEIQSIQDGRSNVVAIVPGARHDRPLLLNAHLDTVGVEGMENPFTLMKKKDRLYGRGAYDMKGSIAVMLLLGAYFTQHQPPMDIILTFVADEEDKSIGMEYFVKNWLPTVPGYPVGGIFLEPTEEQIGVSHKGFIWYELEVIGKEAHGGRPDEGVDAILPLRAALEELSRIQFELKGVSPDPDLGHASLHAGIIEGGTGLTVIPPHSRIQWERRILPHEPNKHLKTELNRVVQAVRAVPGNHKVRGRELFARPPYKVSIQSSIVQVLRHICPHSRLVGFPFWADSALAGAAGIPAVLFGPAGHGAHAIDEWVSLRSLTHVYEVLKRLITTLEAAISEN